MASIIKRCDCGDWDECPHPWVVRYRTDGGRTSKQREQSFGDDLKEAEDFLLKVEHDKKAHVFIDPEAGKAVFRAEAEAWLAQRIGADSSDMTYRSVLRTHVYPAIGHRQIRTIRREEIKEIIVRMSRKGLSPSRIASAHLVIDLLLETAFTTFRAGFLASQVAAMMRACASDPVAIEQINRREVAAHRAEAAASAGLARQAHLVGAIEIARARGLTDVVREVTAELQAIPVKDLGLRRHSTSVRVPADQVERFLHGFTASPEWRDGLRFFLSTDCPVGDLAQLRQQAHDLARVAPLVSVIPLGLLGDDGLPRWTAQSPEEQEAGRMATCARVRAELQGQHLAQGLHRLAERYGTPDQASLTALLSENGQSDSVLAASLARAFLHFWRGDYEACAHVAVPKIEAAARVLLQELDEGIYKLQLGKDQGQYPMLYSLLKELEKLAMDESWTYFLRWLLLAPPGMNIRNDLAHGFTSGISPVYAALILRAAAMLITVTTP